jgi:hypothetical protein
VKISNSSFAAQVRQADAKASDNGSQPFQWLVTGGFSLACSYLWLAPKVLPLGKAKEKHIFLLLFARLFVPLHAKCSILTTFPANEDKHIHRCPAAPTTHRSMLGPSQG